MRRPKAMVRDELGRHLRLSRVICGGECDVMNRALAKLAGKKPPRLAYVDVAADRFTGAEADKRTVFADLVETQHVSQHLRRRRHIFQQECDPVKTADRMFCRYIGGGPARSCLGPPSADKRQYQAV